MIPLKNNNDLTNGLLDRLAACVEQMGGKRAMATAALISEAQLFRYLNGDTDIPSERIFSMARAAGVDVGWLMTGKTGTDNEATTVRPAFRSELMVQVIQLLEELLIEFEKPFNPRQRARAITFLYNAFRHEEMVRGKSYQLHKYDLLKSLNFISELRTEEELEMLNSVLQLLEYSSKTEFNGPELELLRTWSNLLVRGIKGYYSSYAGQVYFERRLGGQLSQAVVLKFQNLVTDICKLTGKTELDWLDLGCGSGRHLVHMAKHMPNLKLRGIELSQLGYTMCKSLMDSEKIPAGCVVMGDSRQLPYASHSFDAIFSCMSLYSLPYLKGTGIGLEEAMSEVARVLRPKGVAVISFPMGNWRDYSMPNQFMDETSLRELVSDLPFDIVKIDVEEQAEQTSNGDADIPSQVKFTYQHEIVMWVTKK